MSNIHFTKPMINKSSHIRKLHEVWQTIITMFNKTIIILNNRAALYEKQCLKYPWRTL